MGLPVWRAPSPEAASHALKDPASLSRSPIRRRRPTRSPRARDLDVQLLSTARPARPYPPAPNVPARNPQRRDEHAPHDHNDHNESNDRHDRNDHNVHNEDDHSNEPSSLVLHALPALTPGFAPATYVDHGRSRRARLTRSHTLRRPANRSPAPAPAPGHDASADLAWDSSHNVDRFADAFPPLRRMGRRTIADGPLPSSSLRESWSPATTLDGLGDRDRSLSPVVDDHWEIMLTSVAPDPLPPTAESSFASAAASASFSNSNPSSRAGSSNSNSASSARTHLTVPSRRQSWSAEFLRACDTSEDDSATDTEAEDDVPDSASVHPRRMLGTAPHAPPPQRGFYSRAIREQARDSTGYVRSFYGEVPLEYGRRMEEQLAAEERVATDEEMPLDQELRDARALLERLVPREDVTDDFWASVGLRRPVADRVERMQQRERL